MENRAIILFLFIWIIILLLFILSSCSQVTTRPTINSFHDTDNYRDCVERFAMIEGVNFFEATYICNL